MSMEIILPPLELIAGIYQHYKGGYYQMIGVGAHSETDERMVVYVSLTASMPGPRLRIRPASMWNDPETWPDGSTGPRFKYIGVEIP